MDCVQMLGCDTLGLMYAESANNIQWAIHAHPCVINPSSVHASWFNSSVGDGVAMATNKIHNYYSFQWWTQLHVNTAEAGIANVETIG